MLVAVIDDATSRAYGKFFEAETTEAYAVVMKEYILKYKIPLALYVDKDSIFRVNRPETVSEGTQFSRMMKELNVSIICANSPQAKGRIERLFGTLQDRLVKEMRLRNISDIKTANKYMEEEYWVKHNKRWSLSTEGVKDVHQEVPPQIDLNRVFTLRHKRKASKSLDFSYHGKLYQIQCKNPHRVHKKEIQIFENFNGSFWIECEGEKLQYSAFTEIPQPTAIIDTKEINAFLNRKPVLTAIQRQRKGMQYPR